MNIISKGMKLRTVPVSYAYWTNALDSETGLEVPGLGVNTVFRFEQPARLKSVTIHPAFAGTEPILADRVLVKAYASNETSGQVIFDGRLTWENGVAPTPLPGTAAIAVAVRCHWKHPMDKPSFDIHHPKPWTVPYYLFTGNTCRAIQTPEWFGEPVELPRDEPPVMPPLRVERVAPRSAGALKAWQDGMFAHFESQYLKASFSLKRPRVSQLAWDALGCLSPKDNFLYNDAGPYGGNPLATNASGPWACDLAFPSPPFLWGGRVDVDGQRVMYRDLTCGDGLRIDAEFEVWERGMILRLAQECAKERTLLEAAAWRFVFDGNAVHSLGTLAMPDRSPGRNGRTQGAGGWHCASRGTLTWQTQDARRPFVMHTENTGYAGQPRLIYSEVQLGLRQEPYGFVTCLAGKAETSVEFRVANLEPILSIRTPVHEGLQRTWGSAFGFRPEHGGLSNNSFSINCSNCQYWYSDMAAYTKDCPPLPRAIDLVRYSVELALKGGPQYAGQFEQAHDSAPSLVSAAGRVFQATRDEHWIKAVWPWLRRAIRHILDNRDETGMYVCRFRSGNSGTFERSCCAWDTFSFGHYDGYSTALAYRALRNAGVLAPVAGDAHLGDECRAAAEKLRQAYVPTLYNEQTGWLSGWRSRDGELHDYAFLFINGAAICYGLVDDDLAKKILTRLEALRVEVGHTDFRYGIASQLRPVPRKDFHGTPARTDGWWFNPLRTDGQDTFGVFTNGGLTTMLAYFYPRALSMHGFRQTADQICDQMLHSFNQGVFEGCFNGTESFTWDGFPSGYEGTLTHSYHVLLGIAQPRGGVKTLEPEWWSGEK